MCSLFWGHSNYRTRAATIHPCTGELRYFLSRYEYRYLNGISLYRKTTKYLSSKIKKLLYQHSEITVLISFMTPYPSTSLFLATGLRHCLVSLCVLPITYFSRYGSTKACIVSISSQLTQSFARNKNTWFVFQFWFQLFLCNLLPFVYYYQWKLKIPKQFSNITSLVSGMLWCIVSCIVSWHLYRDMYRFLRICIVAALAIRCLEYHVKLIWESLTTEDTNFHRRKTSFHSKFESIGV